MAIELKSQDRSKLNLQRSVNVLAGASIMLEGGTSISYAKMLEILSSEIGTGDGSYHIDGGTWDSTYLIDQNLNGGGW